MIALVTFLWFIVLFLENPQGLDDGQQDASWEGYRSQGICDRLALRHQHIELRKLRDNLIFAVCLCLPIKPILLAQDLALAKTTSREEGQLVMEGWL